MAIKPGYKTSEFWFTLVSFLFSGLYLLGIIGDNAQKEDLIRDVSHGVESCILIGGQLLILYKYIKGRSSVKQSWWQTQNENNGDTNDKQRINSSRSRKTNKQHKTKSSRNKKSGPE